MPDSFQLEIVVAAEPQRVFTAWMDAREHASFTGGGEATIESWNGGRFTAWDGYIHGIFLGVEAGKRVVQTWRTAEFSPEMRDSRVAVEFEPVRGGTRVRIRHNDLPSLFAGKLHAHCQTASPARHCIKNRASQSGDDRKARGVFESTSAGSGRT